MLLKELKEFAERLCKDYGEDTSIIIDMRTTDYVIDLIENVRNVRLTTEQANEIINYVEEGLDNEFGFSDTTIIAAYEDLFEEDY